MFLKISQNSPENTCTRLRPATSGSGKFRPQLAFNFIKNETLAQVFPCEFCEIFKNTFLRLCFDRTTPGDCFWIWVHFLCDNFQWRQTKIIFSLWFDFIHLKPLEVIFNKKFAINQRFLRLEWNKPVNWLYSPHLFTLLKTFIKLMARKWI